MNQISPVIGWNSESDFTRDWMKQWIRLYLWLDETVNQTLPVIGWNSESGFIWDWMKQWVGFHLWLDETVNRIFTCDCMKQRIGFYLWLDETVNRVLPVIGWNSESGFTNDWIERLLSQKNLTCDWTKLNESAIWYRIQNTGYRIQNTESLLSMNNIEICLTTA